MLKQTGNQLLTQVTPGMPMGDDFKARCGIAGYPLFEIAGLVFAYLGPEPVPAFPLWEPLTMQVDGPDPSAARADQVRPDARASVPSGGSRRKSGQFLNAWRFHVAEAIDDDDDSC